MTERIRNFSIIAHVDHGKSTLADCFLEWTRAVSKRQTKAQFLDSMDLERERGITIKAQTARLSYRRPSDSQIYTLNLIDTPGHADFSYEVSRSLAACEAALLVVDACQGIEAQTLAHAFLALERDLTIIPVINKIDLPSARIEEVAKELCQAVGADRGEILLASAKEKKGIGEILEAVVERAPPPKGDPKAPAKALVFDSWFDSYQGVVALCRMKEGALCKGGKAYFMGSDRECEILKLGAFTPFSETQERLAAGEVGFVITGIKDIKDVRVGDTLTQSDRRPLKPLEGFQSAKAMVFSGLFPVSSDDFKSLKKALEKLSLNDSSLSFEMESSKALGFGFRCGFLGLLHMEVVRERLEREFNLSLIVTPPTVVYRAYSHSDQMTLVDNPASLPAACDMSRVEEPFVNLSLFSPAEYLGPLLKLCEEKRGVQSGIEYISQEKVIIRYKIPLSEMALDFHDRLKSLTKGYGSMEYDLAGYEPSDLVKLEILLNGEPVDALSLIAHRSQSERRGRALAKKLKELIPRKQYQVAIQAASNGKVIARETLSAFRKDVTAKCYGGDITRKRKLLERQKAGKKKMKTFGQVEIPKQAFLAALKSH